MESILARAVESAQRSEISFCKYITANDTGATGAHQSGFHIPIDAWSLFFNVPGNKGTNKDKFVTIRWQDDFETSSRFIYYGVGTRNEYRLTRFGKGFPYFQDENIGDLLILSKIAEHFYEGFIIESDEEIEEFFAAVNISSSETNGIIPQQFEQKAEDKLLKCFNLFLTELKIDFPPTTEVAFASRNCYKASYNITNQIIKANPDQELLNWLDSEFQLYKIIEKDRYSSRIETPFKTVEELVETANQILNRRKSRAGKSLEHQLQEMFKIFEIPFQSQAITEDNKKPDFIFPNKQAYDNKNFDSNKLIMLAAKTTCKDRWRQVLNEADRIKTKHLFTLQQGISRSQLEEMYKYDVCLVVPKQYVKSYPEEFRERILTLERFIIHVRQIQ